MKRDLLRYLAPALSLVMVLNLQGAEDPPEKNPGKNAETERDFVSSAYLRELAEVKFADYAAKNAKDEKVKLFAANASAEHLKVRDTLSAKAKELKIELPEGLGKNQQARWDKLSKLQGMDLDLEYLKGVLETHEKTLELAKKWAKDAKDSGIRGVAEELERVTKTNWELARKLYSPTSK